MVIAGFNDGFVSMLPDIVISGIQGNLRVFIDLEAHDRINILEEVYSPDADGNVILSINELIIPAYQLPKLDYPLNTGDERPDLIGELMGYFRDDTGEVIKGCYLCFASKPVDERYDLRTHLFLTNCRNKKTQSDRIEYVSYIANNQQIFMGIAYMLDGNVRYLKCLYKEALMAKTVCSFSLTIRDVLDQIDIHDAEDMNPEDVILYEVISVEGGIERDKIRFSLDKKNHVQCTNLIYRNCFGVPDSIALTGMSESEYGMTGHYASVSGFYRKHRTELIPQIKVNTGFITKEVADCCEDLVMSDSVFLYENRMPGSEIVITDVEMNRSMPGYEGISYSITYRQSSDKLNPFKPTYRAKNFDKTFNHTFD